MAIAYILLNVDPGSEDDVLKSIRSTDKVTEAYRIYGIYDTIARIEADSDQIKRTIMQIRGLQHIRSTLTLTTVE